MALTDEGRCEVCVCEINVAFVNVERLCNQLHLLNSIVTFSIGIQRASGALHYCWQTVCVYMPGGKSILLSLWILFIFGFFSFH